MKKTYLFILACTFSFLARSQQLELFRDDYDNNNNKWQEYNDDVKKSYVANGHYVMNHIADKGGFLFYKNFFIPEGTDYTISCKLKQVSGIENNGYGITWVSGDGSNFNTFLVSTNDYVRIYGYKGGNLVDIQPWKKLDTTVINNMGVYNVLKLEKKGAVIRFYVNDNEVAVTEVQNHTGGYVGWHLNQNMEVHVDYIEMMIPPYKIKTVENAINGYKKENLGPNINSASDELLPKISPDGRTLYVVRNSHPENIINQDKDDIWVAELQPDGNFGKLRNIGVPLNNEGSNAVTSVMPDGNTLLLSNTYKSDGGAGGGGVSMAYRTDNGWTVPEALNIKNFYNRNQYSNYMITADRKTLIMAIQRDDSYGAKDLYVSFLQSDGSFSEPLNMGSTINTKGDDFSPFMAADNATLYYSNYSMPGYGSADMFVTRRLDSTWTKWSEPLNLGPEINGTGWDAYFNIPASGNYAYLVSDENSLGKGDVFRIKIPESMKPRPVVLVYGKVLNGKTKAPLAADITYYDLDSDKELGLARSNPADGSYKIVLPAGAHYSFLAKKEGFFSVSQNIDVFALNKYTELEYNLMLAPIEKGETIKLNNLFFDYNKADLKATSHPELNRLIKIMNEYPTMKVEIAGHTDGKGNAEYNQKLSEQRAAQVVNYLTANGMPGERLVAKGYGKNTPVATNETEAGRAQNRRVEFKILEK